MNETTFIPDNDHLSRKEAEYAETRRKAYAQQQLVNQRAEALADTDVMKNFGVKPETLLPLATEQILSPGRH